MTKTVTPNDATVQTVKWSVVNGTGEAMISSNWTFNSSSKWNSNCKGNCN